MTRTLRSRCLPPDRGSWVQLVPADAEPGPRQAGGHRVHSTDWAAAFSGFLMLMTSRSTGIRVFKSDSVQHRYYKITMALASHL